MPNEEEVLDQIEAALEELQRWQTAAMLAIHARRKQLHPEPLPAWTDERS